MYSSVPTSLSCLISSFTIHHGSSGISTSHSVGLCFFQILTALLATIISSALVKALNHIKRRYSHTDKLLINQPHVLLLLIKYSRIQPHAYATSYYKDMLSMPCSNFSVYSLSIKGSVLSLVLLYRNLIFLTGLLLGAGVGDRSWRGKHCLVKWMPYLRSLHHLQGRGGWWSNKAEGRKGLLKAQQVKVLSCIYLNCHIPSLSTLFLPH